MLSSILSCLCSTGQPQPCNCSCKIGILESPDVHLAVMSQYRTGLTRALSKCDAVFYRMRLSTTDLKPGSLSLHLGDYPHWTATGWCPSCASPLGSPAVAGISFPPLGSQSGRLGILRLPKLYLLRDTQAHSLYMSSSQSTAGF